MLNKMLDNERRALYDSLVFVNSFVNGEGRKCVSNEIVLNVNGMRSDQHSHIQFIESNQST